MKELFYMVISNRLTFKRVILAFTFLCVSFGSTALPLKEDQVKNIVLVHGAFVDASSWNGVMSRLMRRGYNVTAVQNPLTSLADDVEATRRILEIQDGPTLLVGYSWGGVPITEAGAESVVKGLVYIAAIAPDVGETVNTLLLEVPEQASMPGAPALLVDDYGNNVVDRDLYHFALAHDSSKHAAKLAAAAQIPMALSAYDESPIEAAWKSKPSWYAVSTEDKIVSPKLQHLMAKNIGADTIEIKSGHASILSQPGKVARLIDRAARSLVGFN